MRLIKNKKGIFFTILAIAILSLFLISYTLYSSAQERKAVQKRIATLNNFVFSVEKDLPRQLYISGFRIIFLFEKKIAETGNYIIDFNSTFNEVFFNVTLYGDTIPDVTAIMQEAAFLDINRHLQESARKINAFANLSNPILTVSQDDPWNVKVTLTADLLVKDNSNLAYWNRTDEIVAYIPIENFEDPLYTLKGRVSNKINKTIYNVPISLADLPSHAANSYYTNNSDAPSFLERLEGRTTPSITPNIAGIESLVNLENLPQEIKDEKGEKSVVDHIYFSDNDPDPLVYRAEIPIDTEHLELYGV